LFFGLLLLIIIAFAPCRSSSSVLEGFSGNEPVLELNVHAQCQDRCKSFIDNVWAPASVWMNGPDGRRLAMSIVDKSDTPATTSTSKLDLATQDITRSTHEVQPGTFPVAKVVFKGVSHVYTGTHDWPAFRRWLTMLNL
jgi:hypothetical protein